MINSTQKRLEKINSKKQNKNTKVSQEATQRYLDESARENARVAQEQNRIAQENAQRQMNDAAQQQINQTNMQNMMMFGKGDKKIEKNRSKANAEYEKNPRTSERVKYNVNKNTKDIARYQTEHEDVDKKKGLAYEYTYDYKRETAVGKKKLIQYSKDHKTGKVLKESNLTNDDYIKAEKKINERKNGVSNDYGSFKSKREERKKAKVEKNVKERLAEIKKNDPEQYEQIKKNTIRTGKASDMKYFVDDMDNNELQYAINRIENKAKLNQLSNKEVKTNWDRAKEVSEKLKIVADLTTNAANIYNNLNKMTPSSNNQNNQQQQKKKN